MSFSREVKVELCQNDRPICCKKAFISAIIKMNSSLGISNNKISINISFENVTIIKYVYELIKEIYKIETQIVVSKQMKLQKNNVYTLKIIESAMEILNDLELMDNMNISPVISKKYYKNKCCHKEYLAGSFVGAGSVNSPNKSNYHLEIQSQDKFHMVNLGKFIEDLNKGRFPLEIHFRMIQRRNHTVLYLKSSREIVDFLNYIGAINSTFRFEDVRMQRDFVNSLNRMNNMDVANEQKVQKAASKQVEMINKIDQTLGLDRIDVKLKKVAKLRLDYPDHSLLELCEVYNNENNDTISKSGMNHRFRKISEIASKINERGAGDVKK